MPIYIFVLAIYSWSMMNGLDSTIQGEKEGLPGFLHFTRILFSGIADIIFITMTITGVGVFILFVRKRVRKMSR
jgi:hypothetical protein